MMHPLLKVDAIVRACKLVVLTDIEKTTNATGKTTGNVLVVFCKLIKATNFGRLNPENTAKSVGCFLGFVKNDQLAGIYQTGGSHETDAPPQETE